ncbi:hypothetical protein SNE40_018359 [Patella caerulea]|uniref:Uncharacterized protein n=1 Tax=Patella caerulea TaxID=87958 RepID=A0AAN8JAA9_PATCE
MIKIYTKINLVRHIQCLCSLLFVCGNIERIPGPVNGGVLSPYVVKSTRSNTRGAEQSQEIDINKSLQSITQTLSDITEQLNGFREEFENINQQLGSITELKTKLHIVEKENRELKYRVNKLGEGAKRNNLLLFGYEESEPGTKEDTESVIRKYLVEKLNILSADSDETLPIERAYRLGTRAG